MIKLTARQQEVLEFVMSFATEKMYPPTRAEIMNHFGWKSANAAEDHLRALERKGYINLASGTSRGISLANALITTTVECEHCHQMTRLQALNLGLDR